MQELITKVAAAAGISDEQAKKAIESVSGYMKEKVPSSFHSQIDNLITGGSLSEGAKEKMNEMAGEFREKAEDVMKDVREGAGKLADKVKGIFSDKKDSSAP